jgi:ribonucleoside-triphosphate reductase (thioredoxin)
VPQNQFTKFDERFLDKYKSKHPDWGFNGLGYIVYKRTYARSIGDGTTEEWWETLKRVVEGAQDIGAQYTKEEAERLFDYMWNLKGLFGGRMLWQLGTDTVKRFGANSLLNCWFVAMREPRAFEFLFENLMLGGGVGFSVKREDVHELPKIKSGVSVTHDGRKDSDFIVPDSREGWVRLLHFVLESYFKTGKSFTYSTVLVRGYGERINGFGGTASGPQILIEGIDSICKVFQSREGKKLRSIDVLDICNIIGSIVVAGNVRRSAEIAIGDPDDYLFLRAKRWDLGNIPNWRAMSNNSIEPDSYDQISEDVWKGYEGNGEPYGFVNTRLAQKFGRLKEPTKDNCEGFNPCAEIGLASYECCNLAELFLNNIESKEQMLDVAKLLFKTQKAILRLPFIHKETEAVVRKNMRVGLGATGFCQALDKVDDWCDYVYTNLREYDKTLSKEWGVNESVKITTVKPSGTLSLLAGATPGIHPGIYQFFIRRIRMSTNDSLVEQCRKLGYSVETAKNFDGTIDRNTQIVSFPCRFDEGTLLAKDVSAVKQMDLVKKIQTVWSDNAVSVTVYYKPEELPEIKEWMKKHYTNSVKSISFLLHSEHGFLQAPYEEIDERKYTELMKKIRPISTIQITSGGVIDDLECASGVCPIK